MGRFVSSVIMSRTLKTSPHSGKSAASIARRALGSRESAKNIKWVARLGTQTYGTPDSMPTRGSSVRHQQRSRIIWKGFRPRSTSAACLCFLAKRRRLPLAILLSRSWPLAAASTGPCRASVPAHWSRAIDYGLSIVAAASFVSIPNGFDRRQKRRAILRRRIERLRTKPTSSGPST